MVMSRAELYRSNAKDCVEQAQRARPRQRFELLRIAGAWLKLADEEAELNELNGATRTWQQRPKGASKAGPQDGTGK
jgi:hypothetical protein